MQYRNKINLNNEIYTLNDISANSSTHVFFFSLNFVFYFNALVFKFSSYVLTLANDSYAQMNLDEMSVFGCVIDAYLHFQLY